MCVVRVNGDRYEGEWRNGRMHGKGVKVMANGDVYNGTWENDKAEGNGVKVCLVLCSSRPLVSIMMLMTISDSVSPNPQNSQSPPSHVCMVWIFVAR